MDANKPSYKTLEFWLSTLAVVVGLLITSGLLPTEGEAIKIVGFISATLAALGYTSARTFQKNSAAKLEANLAAIAKSDKPVNP